METVWNRNSSLSRATSKALAATQDCAEPREEGQVGTKDKQIVESLGIVASIRASAPIRDGRRRTRSSRRSSIRR
jgi:hypothetical protein